MAIILTITDLEGNNVDTIVKKIKVKNGMLELNCFDGKIQYIPILTISSFATIKYKITKKEVQTLISDGTVSIPGWNSKYSQKS